MEIWHQSEHIDSTNRLIASQTQSRTQVIEMPYNPEAPLSTVDYGEIVATVIRGNGLLKTTDKTVEIEAGDQIYLVEGDEFALSAADEDDSFVVQMYWAPGRIEFLA